MTRKSTPVPVTISNFRFFQDRAEAIGGALDTVIDRINERAKADNVPLGELTKAAEVLLNIQLEVGKVSPPEAIDVTPAPDRQKELDRVRREIESRRDSDREATKDPDQEEEAPEEA
jgi:hypothetical protein